MALNHTHTLYDNFVLANEIEDQFNSMLDLARFVKVDRSLVGTAGDTVKIHVYRATDGTEQLEMGKGNTKNITVSYAPEEYKIILLQNRFPYYDEEAMKDPMLIPTGLRHMATDMFNESNKKIMAEFSKTSRSVNATSYNFDAFVDAVAQLSLPEAVDNGKEVFAFINPLQKAEVRKDLKDDLKSVEAFARTGYVGTVAGVNLYTKNDAPTDHIIVATEDAVTYFVKTGTEVEQVTAGNRSETAANVRLNTIFSRKYFIPALTDESQAVKIVKQTV